MDREKILEKSRKENETHDERERLIRMQGESFSLALTLMLGLVLITYKRLHGMPHADVMSMFWISCVADRLYRLTKRPGVSDVITLLISLAFLGYYLIQFFSQGGGRP